MIIKRLGTLTFNSNVSQISCSFVSNIFQANARNKSKLKRKVSTSPTRNTLKYMVSWSYSKSNDKRTRIGSQNVQSVAKKVNCEVPQKAV